MQRPVKLAKRAPAAAGQRTPRLETLGKEFVRGGCVRGNRTRKRGMRSKRSLGGVTREDSRPTGDRLFVPFDDAGRRPRGGGGAHPAAALPGLELHGVL